MWFDRGFKHPRYWTEEESNKLSEAYINGDRWDDICAMFPNRTKHAVSLRRTHMGLHRTMNLNGERNPFYAKRHTQATKDKISNTILANTDRKGENNPAYKHGQSRHYIKRKIIELLDNKCAICGWSEGKCDLHHIIPLKKGGSPDNPSNCIILCPNHHRLVTQKIISTSEVMGVKNENNRIQIHK